MTTIVSEDIARRTRADRPTPRSIPLARMVKVEARKTFDTRSGFWLLASIGIAALLATGAVILFAPDSELTYSTFVKAIRFPVAVILPLIAILSVTSEWSQRSGLTTFHPGTAPESGHPGEGDLIGHRGGPVDAAGFRDRSARQPGGYRNNRHRPCVGRIAHRLPAHRPRQRPEAADRPTLGVLIRTSSGAIRGVLRLLVPAASGLRPPGRQPGLVPGPCSPGSTSSTPRAPSSSSRVP